MKHTVRDVIRVMDAWAPPGLAYEWDRIGLSLGRPDARVRTILTVLSITVDAARAAVASKADMIVSHHPLIWDAIKSIRTDDAAREPLLTLVKANVSCFAAHTNLDICAGGVNDVLAQSLGVGETRPLFPAKHASLVKLIAFVPETHLAAVRQAVSAAGAGEIGDYTQCSFSTPGTGTFLPGPGSEPFAGKKGQLSEESEARFETVVQKAILSRVLDALQDAHPYEEVAYDLVPLQNSDPRVGIGRVGTLATPVTLKTFAERARKALGVAHVRVTGDLKRPISRVALMGGAGGGQIGDVPAGIDVYVTGDVKYHEAQLALDRGLAVIDAGHHGTERGIVPAISARLRAAFPEVSVVEYREPDPFVAISKKESKSK